MTATRGRLRSGPVMFLMGWLVVALVAVSIPILIVMVDWGLGNYYCSYDIVRSPAETHDNMLRATASCQWYVEQLPGWLKP